MILNKISYNNGSWSYKDLELEKINLIIGKNASGKTRTLVSIKNIISFIAQKNKKIKGNYEIEFLDEKNIYKYFINIQNGIVKKEKLLFNNEDYLIREENGTGNVYSEYQKEKIEFSIDNNVPAIFSKRDKLHHPLLEKINQWCQLNMFCEFGSQLGKTTGTTNRSIEEKEENDLYFTELEFIVRNLRIASKKKYKDEFKKKLLEQMKQLDYFINDISFVKYNNTPSGEEVYGIKLMEEGVEKGVGQLEMSQGMFRAFSILVHTLLNYYEKRVNLIIIDDIGEGLDYNRSTKLIKLVINNAKESNTQLLMATNDRYVMNSIPLKYWHVINKCKDNSLKFYSYKNSKERFDEFEYTGLSNFDFFLTSFYLEEK